MSKSHVLFWVSCEFSLMRGDWRAEQKKTTQGKSEQVFNEQGKAIGKKDSQGNFVPYKRRGRAPKNLAQK